MSEQSEPDEIDLVVASPEAQGGRKRRFPRSGARKKADNRSLGILARRFPVEIELKKGGFKKRDQSAPLQAGQEPMISRSSPPSSYLANME